MCRWYTARRRTDKDYLMAAVDTALDIHLQQPPGDILVFLTRPGRDREGASLASAICVALVFLAPDAWSAGGPQ